MSRFRCAFASRALASANAFTGTSTYAIYKLTNSTYQDLITATKLDVPNTVVQVPEPQTYAMLLAGLVGAAVVYGPGLAG